MGEVVIHKTKDRVSISYARKINVGNYQSVDIHAGYSTDVKKDETVEQAFERADKVASEQLETLCAPIEKEITKGGKHGR